MSDDEGKGFTIWLTGLLFSGKKALARVLEMRLKSMGLRVTVLEGGQLRRRFEDTLGFTKEQVEHNLRRICFEAGLLAEAGEVAIVAAISPFREHREECRKRLGRLIEVFCDCPMEELERRDHIGFYAKARRGELENVAGVSFAYEEPLAPEVHYRSDRESPEAACQRVLKVAEAKGYIASAPHSVLTEAEERALRERLRRSWGR